MESLRACAKTGSDPLNSKGSDPVFAQALTVRHLPFLVAGGPEQMAADEVMLQTAIQGMASLRLYQWAEPTVSLGYFQSHREREQHSALLQIPFVRRCTGGLTLVHHHELTYALTLPADYQKQPAAWWLTRIHQIIADVLSEFGVKASVAEGDPASGGGDSLCFRHITAGDLTIGPAKVVGSAQRRQRGALLQHGAILLGTSPFAPILPGVAELSGRTVPVEELQTALPVHLTKTLGYCLKKEAFTETETARIQRLVLEKYQHPVWNEKR